VTYASVGIAEDVSLPLDVLRGTGESEVEQHYVQPDYKKNEDSCQDRCNSPVCEYSHQIPIPSKPPERYQRERKQ